MLGFAAFFLILWGGAGTQSKSMLMQGGGIIGLIVGLVVLYIFAKMAWRAMGCLPSFLIIAGIITFILYAIGAFNNGVGGIGETLKSFLGQGGGTMTQANVGGVVNLLEEEDFSAPIGENFSSSIGDSAPQQAPAPANRQAFNPQNFPAVYGAAKVVSGDTLVINGRYFRIYGIDAPEINQTCADFQGRSYTCGKQAAAWLSDWILDYELECRVMQRDSRGNMIGTCSLGAYDLGAALVNAGWAIPYLKHTDIYLPYQQQAQDNMRGLWQGKFYTPEDWRKLQSRKPKIKIINKPQQSGGFMGIF